MGSDPINFSGNKKVPDETIYVSSRTIELSQSRCHLDSQRIWKYRFPVRLTGYQHIHGNWRMPHVVKYLSVWQERLTRSQGRTFVNSFGTQSKIAPYRSKFSDENFSLFPHALGGPFACGCYRRASTIPGSLKIPLHTLYPLHRFKVLYSVLFIILRALAKHKTEF